MSTALTAKQARFVAEYLCDLNATQAAIRAGYSPKTARSIGYENLTKPHIADAIADGKSGQIEEAEITAQRVLNELGRIGFADIRNLFEWSEERAAFVPSRDLTEDQAAAVASVKAETTHFTRDDGTTETKIKLELKTHDKLGALREIGKHLGIAEKHDHTVTPGGVMVVPSDAIPQDWAAHAREQQQALTESAGEEVAKVLPHLGSGDGG